MKVMNEDEILDWQVGILDRTTSGADAHHAMQPDELAMMHEEGDEYAPGRPECDRLREEVFTAVCEHVMAEGPRPWAMKARMEGLMRQFAKDELSRMDRLVRWWDERDLAEVLRRYEEAKHLRGGAPRSRFSAWDEDDDPAAVMKDSFRRLCAFWVSEGYRWRAAVAAQLVLVKALRPELLPIVGVAKTTDHVGLMSLEDLAVICGDKGRATVSARVKRLFNRRIRENGGRDVLTHFQKSRAAVESYRSAQKGNTNRRKK